MAAIGCGRGAATLAHTPPVPRRRHRCRQLDRRMRLLPTPPALPCHVPAAPLQHPEAEKRGALQLLDSLDVAAAASALPGLAGPSTGAGSSDGGAAAGGALPMPPGFLEDFGARFADEGLGDVMSPIGGWDCSCWGVARLGGQPGGCSHRSLPAASCLPPALHTRTAGRGRCPAWRLSSCCRACLTCPP